MNFILKLKNHTILAISLELSHLKSKFLQNPLFPNISHISKHFPTLIVPFQHIQKPPTDQQWKPASYCTVLCQNASSFFSCFLHKFLAKLDSQWKFWNLLVMRFWLRYLRLTTASPKAWHSHCWCYQTNNISFKKVFLIICNYSFFQMSSA